VPVVTGIAALNAFVPFFPVELFLILRVLVRHKEWWRIALIAAAASGLGAVGLARLVDYQPHAEIVPWLARHFGEASWEQVSQFVRHRGAVGLALISMSFLPLPPAVIMCALSKVPDWQIALSIGLGNALKYGFFSWLAASSPLWFGFAESERVPS
jgi:membrane protein YqaA with SNARE-associated domain